MGGGLWVMGYVWWVVGCSATVACVHWERRRRRVPKKDAYFQEAIDRLEGRLQIWYGISAEDEWGGVVADLWNIRPTHRNWDIASARRALRCVLCTYVCTVHCVMCVGEVWPVSMIGNMSANGKLRYVCVTCVGYVIRGNALSPLHPPAAGWSGAAICSSVSPSRATWSSGLGSGTSTTASTAGNRLLPARTASTLCVVCYGLRLHCVLWVVCYGSCEVPQYAANAGSNGKIAHLCMGGHRSAIELPWNSTETASAWYPQGIRQLPNGKAMAWA
eukprot:gene22749-biopygen2772